MESMATWPWRTGLMLSHNPERKTRQFSTSTVISLWYGVIEARTYNHQYSKQTSYHWSLGSRDTFAISNVLGLYFLAFTIFIINNTKIATKRIQFPHKGLLTLIWSRIVLRYFVCMCVCFPFSCFRSFCFSVHWVKVALGVKVLGNQSVLTSAMGWHLVTTMGEGAVSFFFNNHCW